MEHLFLLSYHEWPILGTYLLRGAVILLLTFIAHKMLGYIEEQHKISQLRDQHLRSLLGHNNNKLEMVKAQIQVLGLAFEALNNGAKDNFDWLQQNIIDQRQMTGLLREDVLKRIDEASERNRIGFHLTRDFEKKEATALTMIADAVVIDTFVNFTTEGALNETH